jgi:transcription elongation factor GreA
MRRKRGFLFSRKANREREGDSQKTLSLHNFVYYNDDSNMPENRISKEGYEKLTADLEEMKNSGRADIVKAISEARAFGDLSENAEYEAAKNDQALLEKRISELESRLANAIIIDELEIDTDTASLGATVRFRLQGKDGIQTYLLVSPLEADLEKKRLSVDSPIGQGLLGKKKGDSAEIILPTGKKKKVTITSVS